VAYSPQETLIVLLAAGTAALAWELPIALAVVALLTIVITSYQQTIHAYPKGGGSYIVAHRNLGRLPGLIAASALIVGYTLTVSVSIASAVDQLVSAVQVLGPLRVWIAVAIIALMTLANLRGISESGSLFAIPTYAFLVAMYAMLITGLVLMFSGNLVLPPPERPAVAPTQALTIFLLLRAFAVASAVMTGTEAISDGILAFKPPEPRNAARTLITMGVILATMFLGLTTLIIGTHVIPSHDETLISQFARAIFGDGPFYYVLQATTVLILVLAANTAYADFPRLLMFLARDNYAPQQFAHRGERLAFSNGIVALGVLGALLIVVFGGSTGALLPLYAFSVFLAFTMSQAGMVKHWLREKGPYWRLKIGANGTGAVVTALITAIAGITNFMNPNLPILPGLPVGWGAWLIFLIIPLLISLFLKVHQHYAEVETATMLPSTAPPLRKIKNVVVVPIARLHQPTVLALEFAASLSPNVTAVHVATDPQKADLIEDQWTQWSQGVPLVVIESPYRSLTAPLLQFLSEIKILEEADIVTVVLPEFVPDSWWEHLLHGQSAQFLKLMLLFTPGFVVASVPSHEVRVRPAKNGAATPADARTR
jgi:amino acid transporter